MITPREMLRDYMTVLNILMQNPEACFDSVVRSKNEISADNGSNDTIKNNNQTAGESILDVLEF